MQNNLTCPDLDCIISMLVGRRTTSGIIQIDEAALENYGSEEFERVFAFICSLKHVQLLSVSEDVSFVAALSHVIHRKIKTAMKELVWQPQHVDVLGKFAKVVDSKGGLGTYLCDHFEDVDKGKKVHIESVTKNCTF